MQDLTDRVAVVTGGNRGIGLGIARALAAAGATVAIWARDAERNADAVATLAATGARALAVPCDISREDDVARAMADTLAATGHVDVLVANAGLNRKTPFLQMSFDEWRAVMAVNLDGTFLCTRAAARHMVERGEGGAIVIVSSIVARYGAPTMEHYAATKAALVSLARSLAVELAPHRIRCNALLPGWTDTELAAEWLDDERFTNAVVRRTPTRRWGEPGDFAPAAVYLADPTLTFHTGDAMTVDGGYTVA